MQRYEAERVEREFNAAIKPLQEENKRLRDKLIELASARHGPWCNHSEWGSDSLTTTHDCQADIDATIKEWLG